MKHIIPPTALGLSADQIQSYEDGNGGRWTLHVRDKPTSALFASNRTKTQTPPLDLNASRTRQAMEHPESESATTALYGHANSGDSWNKEATGFPGETDDTQNSPTTLNEATDTTDHYIYHKSQSPPTNSVLTPVITIRQVMNDGIKFNRLGQNIGAVKTNRVHDGMREPVQLRKAGDDSSPWDDINAPQDANRVSYEALTATRNKRLEAHERKASQDLLTKDKFDRSVKESPLRRRQEPFSANERDRRGSSTSGKPDFCSMGASDGSFLHTKWKTIQQTSQNTYHPNAK